MHPIFILIILVAVVITVRKLKDLPPERRGPAGFKAALAAAALIVLLAIITGRLTVLTGIIAAAIPLLQRVMTARAFFERFRASGDTPGRDDQVASTEAARADTMSVREAAQILEVGEDAGRDTVISAHRRLIQRMHPDRGGSSYLASRINLAKDVLLAQR